MKLGCLDSQIGVWWCENTGSEDICPQFQEMGLKKKKDWSEVRSACPPISISLFSRIGGSQNLYYCILYLCDFILSKMWVYVFSGMKKTEIDLVYCSMCMPLLNIKAKPIIHTYYYTCSVHIKAYEILLKFIIGHCVSLNWRIFTCTNAGHFVY